MLSILLPIYNWDVRQLVKDLVQQGRTAGIVFEIICLDDGSTEEFCRLNRSVTAWQWVRYEELPQNLGRAQIRNRLAEQARYPHLLFLDGDSAVEDAQFLGRYLEEVDPEKVVCGGRSYAPELPLDPRLHLHWHYGRQREARPAALRQASPYAAFMTNNFWIPRQHFSRLQFTAQLRDYGHEDTLFGQDLQRLGIPIEHRDNPVRHLGLEPAEVFLQKTEQALRNLFLLAQTNQGVATRLTATFNRCRQWGLAGILARLYPLWGSQLRRRLLRSPVPPLWWLDVYKLLYLAQLFRQDPRST